MWGDELAELAIVVEPMHGIDGLVEMVAEFEPSAQRRLGVLVDHLVTGSKEERITRQVAGPHVLVTGHPFVDVWAGVRPQVMGLDDVAATCPRSIEWKQGMCAALGVSLTDFWPRLRNRVRTFADLRPELVGAVEQLIDFVAPPRCDRRRRLIGISTAAAIASITRNGAVYPMKIRIAASTLTNPFQPLLNALPIGRLLGRLRFDDGRRDRFGLRRQLHSQGGQRHAVVDCSLHRGVLLDSVSRSVSWLSRLRI